jgi:probable HAF family extracellular repeat protein
MFISRLLLRICRKFVPLTFCLCAAVIPAVPATITPLGLSFPVNPYYGGNYSYATAINNSGEVVGYTYQDMPLVTFSSPFLYSNGVVNDILGPLDILDTLALGINNHGQIVGSADSAFLISNGQYYQLNSIATAPSGLIFTSANAINDSDEIGGAMGSSVYCAYSAQGCHAFLESNGTATDLTTLSSNGYTPQSVTSLNNTGQAVGNGVDSSGNPHSFLYANGSVTELPFTTANAINSSGEIAGASGTGMTGTEAVLYSNGTVADLGSLGGNSAAYSVAYGINDSGSVVGTYAPTPCLQYYPEYCDLDAFLYANGALIDLNSLLPPDSGWQLYEATGINDSGQIIGDGTLNGQYEGFLLDMSSATPEPGSATLIAAAFLLLSAMFVSQRRARR